MIEAWFSRSQRMTSSLPQIDEIAPRFVWNPVEKHRAASLPMKRASRRSNSSCNSRVPFKNREPEHDVPNFSSACWAASNTLW